MFHLSRRLQHLDRRRRVAAVLDRDFYPKVTFSCSRLSRKCTYCAYPLGQFLGSYCRRAVILQRRLVVLFVLPPDEKMQKRSPVQALWLESIFLHTTGSPKLRADSCLSLAVHRNLFGRFHNPPLQERWRSLSRLSIGGGSKVPLSSLAQTVFQKTHLCTNVETVPGALEAAELVVRMARPNPTALAWKLRLLERYASSLCCIEPCGEFNATRDSRTQPRSRRMHCAGPARFSRIRNSGDQPELRNEHSTNLRHKG